MKPDPKTEFGRALRDAGRIPGWNLRAAAIRRFQVGRCQVIVVPVRIFADHRNRKRLLANASEHRWSAPSGGAA